MPYTITSQIFYTSMKNFVLFLFCISSDDLITNVLALRTEGILNGDPGTRIQRNYAAGIFAQKNCIQKLKLIGSGALVDTSYVLSAAHHFVDRVLFGRYKLMSKTFYVHLSSSELFTEFSEFLPVQTFYLLDYNSTNGQNDLILLKIGQPDLIGILPWDAVHVATQNMHELTILDGTVASYGLHNTAQGLDGNLRFALANMADNSECDNILDANSSQICIKMYKDDKNRPRGLCKYDGGAPFVVRNMNENYLVGIADKPKENCDDTERGAVYTDVRPFHSHIISIIAGNLVASQILEPHALGGFACLNLIL